MSNQNYDLNRFIDAHKYNYETALREFKEGRKRSHWMWYIFPQITGLGESETSEYYAIHNMDEAIEYMAHPVLRSHMYELVDVLLNMDNYDIKEVFDFPDDIKLQSSMTLFYFVSLNKVFKAVLDKYYSGEYDKRTIDFIHSDCNKKDHMFNDMF